MSNGIRISDKAPLAGVDHVYALHNGTSGPLPIAALVSTIGTPATFASRALLRAAWSDGLLPDGRLVSDGRVLYIAQAGATDIPDLPGLKPYVPGYGDAHFWHFADNAVPGVVDSTADLAAALVYVQAVNSEGDPGAGGVLLLPAESILVADDDADGVIFTIRKPMTLAGHGQLATLIRCATLTDTVFLVQPLNPMDGDVLTYVNFRDLLGEQDVDEGLTVPTSSRFIRYDRASGTLDNVHSRNWFRHYELNGCPEGMRFNNIDTSSTVSFDVNSDTPGNAKSSAHIAIMARKMTPGVAASYHDMGEVNYTGLTGGTFTIGNSVVVDANNYAEIIDIDEHDDGTTTLKLVLPERVGHFYPGDTLTEYTENAPPFSTPTGVSATATLGTATMVIGYDNLAGGTPVKGNALVLDASNYGVITDVRGLEVDLEVTGTLSDNDSLAEYVETSPPFSTATGVTLDVDGAPVNNGNEIDVTMTGTLTDNASLTEYEETEAPFSTATGVTLNVDGTPWLGGNYWLESNTVMIDGWNGRAGALVDTDHTEFALLMDSIDFITMTNSHPAWGDTAPIGIIPRQYNISMTNLQLQMLCDPLPLATRSLHGIYIKDDYRMGNSSASDLVLGGGTVIAGCSSHGLFCDCRWQGMTFGDGATKLVGDAAFYFDGNVSGIDGGNWRCRNVGFNENGFACLHLVDANGVRWDGLRGNGIEDLVRVPSFDLGTGIGAQDVSLGGLHASNASGKVVNADTAADYFVTPDGHSTDEVNLIKAASSLYLPQIYGKFTITGPQGTVINGIDTTCRFDGREFTLIFSDSYTLTHSAGFDLGGWDLETEAGMVLKFVCSRSITAGLNKVQLLNRPPEEKDWTPVITDGTTTATAAVSGHYQRVGKRVTVSGSVACSSLNGMTGNPRMSGLPFVAASGRYGGGVAVQGSGLNLGAASGVDLTLRAIAGQDFMQIYRWDAGTGTTQITAAELSDSGAFEFEAVYFTD
ncbi:hypothetical protein KUV64_05360 [Mameliella alba]|uniref:hypothetical protein n=1 Tax=Mameliella alba TaxID=561184 RepID=UPI001C97E6B4|nr:hypothetical protein [Mameliella alba]MBY6118550.1 hypothetical protein [Mameliella alba]